MIRLIFFVCILIISTHWRNKCRMYSLFAWPQGGALTVLNLEWWYYIKCNYIITCDICTCTCTLTTSSDSQVSSFPRYGVFTSEFVIMMLPWHLVKCWFSKNETGVRLMIRVMVMAVKKLAQPDSESMSLRMSLNICTDIQAGPQGKLPSKYR